MADKEKKTEKIKMDIVSGTEKMGKEKKETEKQASSARCSK